MFGISNFWDSVVFGTQGYDPESRNLNLELKTSGFRFSGLRVFGIPGVYLIKFMNKLIINN